MGWEGFFPSGAQVIALPSWRNPRLYLPARGFFETWERSSFYPASRFRARFYRTLLRAKASAGLSKVRMVEESGWALGEFVRQVVPEAAHAVVLVGTLGPAQKITAQLLDKKDQVVGYVKYAEKEAARNRLRKEWRMLHNLPCEVGPKPLKHGLLGDGEAILITPVPGRWVPRDLPPAKGVDALLSSLVVLPAAPLEDHPWVQRIRERSKFEFDPWLETLTRENWPVVVQHGDFVPWNLLRRPDGTIGAIDWEYGTLEGFPFLDLVYYLLQTSALIYRWAPSKAVEYAVKYLSLHPQLTLSRVEARTLTRLAAYDAYHKSLEDGHALGNVDLQSWRRAVWESKT